MERLNFNGKVVIITGGASGIGAATARKLASCGAILSLMDLNGDGLKTVADECANLSAKYNNPQPFVFTGDVTDDAVRQKFVDDTLKQFGKLDILINNAGILRDTSVFDPSMEVADKLYSILLRAPYDMCRLTAKHLVKTQGSIINVSSIAAHCIGSKSPAYHSAKAAIVQLTKSLADELGPHNVRVNSISPGIVKTNIYPTTMLTPELLEMFTKAMSLIPRTAQPEEIANVIAFMVSDENTYMTGSDVLVDGGMFAKCRLPIPNK